MALDTLLLIAARYDNEEDAVADYNAAKALYTDLGIVDTYDAAVISRREDGKVKIVHKHEQPTRQGAWGGLGIGLVGGALVALFPAVAIGGALVWGGAGGAALGALAGHVVGGVSRGDLKDLGELLDEGESGLLVIAAADLGERVEQSLSRAAKLEKKQLRADEKAAEKDIDDAVAALNQ